MRRLSIKYLLLSKLTLCASPLLHATHPDEECICVYQTARSYGLKSFDQLLTWAFPPQRYAFSLEYPLNTKTFYLCDANILFFADNYNYFSDKHPLIAKVTSDPVDLDLTRKLFIEIHLAIRDKEQRELLTNEVLAKVLAYRELEEGDQISIPSQENQLTRYTVDKVFDLGHGMPAFGLTSVHSEWEPPILLFRGTDVAVFSKRGLASMVSDLDPKGPGLTAFLGAQQKIHDWLSTQSQKGSKAKVVGFSLGGILASYTYIYEQDLISNNPAHASAIFNPPGGSKQVYRDWQHLSPQKKELLHLFVTKGDLIPKVGKLTGNITELSTNHPLFPIKAHVSLISAMPIYYQNRVDLPLENRSNRFSR